MPGHLDPGRPCACASGKSFATCCRPYLRGEREAPDAVSLMRSRFSAFALEHAAYLFRTLHPEHPDRARPEADVLREVRRACRAFDYRGVTILEHGGPDEHGLATVKFLAQVFKGPRDLSFTELSTFKQDGAGWRYLSGEPKPVSASPEPS